MKKITYIFILSLSLFIACDKIEGPYISISDAFHEDDFPELDRSTVYRKVLLEEYTGYKCSNCPSGHAKVSELSLIYGDTLVPICIHAGVLAKPSLGGLFVYDFRIEEGEQLFTDFGLDAIPAAVVNRIKYGGDAWSLSVDQWQNAVNSIDRNTVYAGIQIQTERESQNILKINTKTTMLKSYATPLQLSVFFVEDNIIKPQIDGTQNDTTYTHNHVLRASLNGTYGARLTTDGILAKDSAYVLGYRLNFTDKDWKMEDGTVVAILHDPNTKEVLQVATKKN